MTDITHYHTAVASKTKQLNGVIAIPGDKSISHRALLIGLIANGVTTITNLLMADDIMATMTAARHLGATIDPATDHNNSSSFTVTGTGGALVVAPPEFDFGNSGTGVRLTMGLIAGHPVSARFVGDHSLQARPMERVLNPLRRIGAKAESTDGHLPVTITGTYDPIPLTHDMAIASAQVKSAILLASLNSSGITEIREKVHTRDHTERMLKYFGAQITTTKVTNDDQNNGNKIILQGGGKLTGQPVAVPTDPSSAAFAIVAALITPNSMITIKKVLMNPTRIGFIDALLAMGGDITISNQTPQSNEPVADITVRSSKLKAIATLPQQAPSMIDEFPVLAIAAACAEGTTRLNGVGELRVKESDRFAAIVNGLNQCGVSAQADGDDIIIKGNHSIAGGATITTNLDHRIAMAFLVLGLIANEPVAIDNPATIATSFPNFFAIYEIVYVFFLLIAWLDIIL